LRILCLLADGEACGRTIQERVGRPLPTTLTCDKLADHGVLRSRIVGTRTYYALRSVRRSLPSSPASASIT
jgi:hypothetical protein